MYKFREINSDWKKIKTNSGKAEKIIYKLVNNKGEEPYLKAVGKDNVQDKINSFKDTCDIKKLIEKYQMLGDESILNQRQGFYADMTDVPNNLIDIKNITEQGKEVFENLNKKYKGKFESFDDFLNVLVGGENVVTNSSDSVELNVNNNNNSIGGDVNE